jgi:hypothetical protein
MNEIAQKIINFIEQAADNNQSLAVGLRGLYKDEVKVGKKLKKSWVWEDGIKKSKRLSGTCVLNITSDTFYQAAPSIEHIHKMIGIAGMYGDARMIGIIVGDADGVEGGEDAHEIIIKNAKLFDVL